MPKSQPVEIIEENCGARLRSKKNGFLRVAPQTARNPLKNKADPLRSNCGAMRSNCGGETPHTPHVRCTAPRGVGRVAGNARIGG